MTEKVKKLGKNYIKPVEVQTNDVFEIIRKPEIRILEADTKKQRERYEVEIKGIKTFNLDQKWRIATLNTTSSDLLMEAFGDNPENWVNKLVKATKRLEKVAGVDKEVLYFEPYINPQVELPKPEPLTKPTMLTVSVTPEEKATIEAMRQKK